jgi:sarcosine oxidase/L-pipecolate oxidase
MCLIYHREAITPNEDFVICQHPHCENLYVATAGSFHGWKFLPILGRYVVQLLDDELDPELVKTWAWDRDNGSAPYGDMWPKRELRDLLDRSVDSPRL